MGKLKCLNSILVLVTGPQKASATYNTKIIKANLENGVNILSLLDFSEPNTKYVIKWDFDLKGQIITIPENCIIEFDGGSLSNGTLIGNDTYIVTYLELDKILKNVDMLGTFKYSVFGSIIEYNADEEGTPTDLDLLELIVNTIIEILSNNTDLSLRFTEVIVNKLVEEKLLAIDDLSDVTLNSPTEGLVLKYDGEKWTNGTGGGNQNPTLNIQKEGGGSYVIIINGEEVDEGTLVSPGTTVTIEVTPEGAENESVNKPVISGTTPFTTSTSVTISCDTTGSTIYYTTNGFDPTNANTVYNLPITLSNTTTVKAIATKTSSVMVFTFTMPETTPEVIVNTGVNPSVTVNGTSLTGQSKGFITSPIATKIFNKESSPTPTITTYTVTLNVTNGTVNGSNTQTVQEGSNATFTVVPNSGYKMPTTLPSIPNVTLEIQANNVLAVLNVTSNVTISLSCVADTTPVDPTPEGPLTDNEGYVEGDEFELDPDDNGKIMIWATKNLGANTPLDSGLFYSWGNIDGYLDPTTFFNDGSSAGNMNGGTSNLEFNSYNFNLEDYLGTSGYNLIEDIPVNNTSDAAYAATNGEWRMPTKVEYEYLIENYSPELVTKNGVQGVKFTRTLVGGDTISMFLPLSGAIVNGTNGLKGDAGYFWTSTIDQSTINNKDSKQAYFAAYDEDNISDVRGSILCYLGLPIRPIKVRQQ